MTAFVRNNLFIAWRYLAYHKVRTVILIGALSIIVFVPLFLEILVRESREQLTARADTTPLVIGALGSSLDLVMNSLYFTKERPNALRMGDARAIDASGLAKIIPLYTRFRAGGFPIVGTTLEYFEFRGLQIAEGRPLAILGDAVIGGEVAAHLGMKAGGNLISSPEDLFNIAGQYPLKLNIAGILARTGSPDDQAIFVDVRTAWAIEGLGHGHEDLAATSDPTVILKRDDREIIANAKLTTYTAITPDNLSSFHFHGEPDDFAITGAIVIPEDQRAGAILLGRYQAADYPLQLARPAIVIQELIETIFRIKALLDGVVIVVAFATVIAIALVFILSLRLREKEIETIFRLGCSRGAIVSFVLAEIFLIALVSLVLSTGLTVAAGHYANDLLFHLLG